MTPKTKGRPRLKLACEDGNAFMIVARARRALRNAGYSNEDIQRYTDEANSGDYDHLLRVTMEWCDVR